MTELRRKIVRIEDPITGALARVDDKGQAVMTVDDANVFTAEQKKVTHVFENMLNGHDSRKKILYTNSFINLVYMLRFEITADPGDEINIKMYYNPVFSSAGILLPTSNKTIGAPVPSDDPLFYRDPAIFFPGILHHEVTIVGNKNVGIDFHTGFTNGRAVFEITRYGPYAADVSVDIEYRRIT